MLPPAPASQAAPDLSGASLNLQPQGQPLQAKPIHPAVTQALPTNPDGLKAMIVLAHPGGIAADGRNYADIPAPELAQKIVAKFPNGVTNDGRKYSDFIPTPTFNPASNPFPNALENIRSGNSDANLNTGAGAIKEILNQASSAGAQNAGPVGADMLKNAPDFAKNIDSLKTMTTPANAAQAQGAYNTKFAETAAPLIDATGGIVRSFAEHLATPTTEQAANAKLFMDKNVVSPETDAIAEKIAPKVNAKETRLALAQGRIIPGQDPGLLSDGTPDQVIPSEQINRAAATIGKQIPGAKDLSLPELYGKLDGKISEISTNLRPQMDATPIRDSTVEQITKDWEALKAKQASDPYLPTNVNIEKLQASFENDILKASKSDNLGDLWDSRIKYDNSVPPSVKNATSLSSDSLQAQKSLWLQNRAVLNAAINDAQTGLGKVSQQAFSDMTDMYNAQKGIQSSYKVSAEGAPSRASQLITKIKSHKIITGAALYETAKHTVAPYLPGF